MKIKTNTIIQILHVLTWVFFIGVCMKAGSLFFSFIVSLWINPDAATNLFMGLNLSALYRFSVALIDNLRGGPEFIYFGGIIFIMAQVFKRGLEIQTENELTI